MSQYPQREGEPDCRDFLRTGRCKYGESCKYHHPLGGAKTLKDPSQPPFPIRPNEPPCQYYLKHGNCKFGQACKFHHPPHILPASHAGGALYMNLGNVNLLCQPVVKKCIIENKNSHINNGADDYLKSRSFIDMLPQRPGKADCVYFLRNGKCKYGASCKYHHPMDAYSLAPSNLDLWRSSTFVSDGLNTGSSQSANRKYLPRKNALFREGAVATHVLFSDEGSIAIVPINKGSAFQHRRGRRESDSSCAYSGQADDEYHKRQYSPRNNAPSLTFQPVASFDTTTFSPLESPSSFQNVINSKSHSSTLHHSYEATSITAPSVIGERRYSSERLSNLSIQREDKLLPKCSSCGGMTEHHIIPGNRTNELSRMYKNNCTCQGPTLQKRRVSLNSLSESGSLSNGSLSSSLQSGEHHSDKSISKNSQDSVCTDIQLQAVKPLDNFSYNEKVATSQDCDNSNQSSHILHSNVDDGLSMMTSTLLTMIDSAEDIKQKEFPLEEPNRIIASPHSDQVKGCNLQENSFGWSSNTHGCNSEMVETVPPVNDSFCPEDNLFQPFSNMDNTNPKWLHTTTSMAILDCSRQVVAFP